MLIFNWTGLGLVLLWAGVLAVTMEVTDYWKMRTVVQARPNVLSSREPNRRFPYRRRGAGLISLTHFGRTAPCVF